MIITETEDDIPERAQGIEALIAAGVSISSDVDESGSEEPGSGLTSKSGSLLPDQVKSDFSLSNLEDTGIPNCEQVEVADVDIHLSAGSSGETVNLLGIKDEGDALIVCCVLNNNSCFNTMLKVL